MILDVRPSLPSDRAVNGVMADAKFTRERSTCLSTLDAATNLANRDVGQTDARRLLSARRIDRAGVQGGHVSPFGHHVLHVVGLRAQEEMGRPNATSFDARSN